MSSVICNVYKNYIKFFKLKNIYTKIVNARAKFFFKIVRIIQIMTVMTKNVQYIDIILLLYEAINKNK